MMHTLSQKGHSQTSGQLCWKYIYATQVLIGRVGVRYLSLGHTTLCTSTGVMSERIQSGEREQDRGVMKREGVEGGGEDGSREKAVGDGCKDQQGVRVRGGFGADSGWEGGKRTMGKRGMKERKCNKRVREGMAILKKMLAHCNKRQLTQHSTLKNRTYFCLTSKA